MNKKTVLAFLCGIPLISCSVFGSSDYGFVRASVKFPYRSFNIKVIPENTNTILVKVSGQGLNEPILFELNRNNTSKLLKNVPEGDKQVNASAIDENGNIIAKGQNSVNVIAQQLNTVEVELQLNDKLNPSPSPSPEPVDCQIQLEEKDLPLPENLAKAIQEAGCKVVPKQSPTPTPSFSPTAEPSLDTSPSASVSASPSSSPVSSSQNDGSFASGSSGGSNTNNVNASINVIDGQQKDSPDIILNSNQ